MARRHADATNSPSAPQPSCSNDHPRLALPPRQGLPDVTHMCSVHRMVGMAGGLNLVTVMQYFGNRKGEGVSWSQISSRRHELANASSCQSLMVNITVSN